MFAGKCSLLSQFASQLAASPGFSLIKLQVRAIEGNGTTQQSEKENPTRN